MPTGIDEAGRGPVMGPMVVAAYWAHDEDRLRGLGVRDSKALSPSTRERLAKSLVDGGTYSLLVIPAASIDQAREGMTLNELEVLCFSTVGASVLLGRKVLAKGLPEEVSLHVEGRVPGDGIFKVDAADVLEERFGTEVRSGILSLTGGCELTVLSKHRADRDHPCVGAASIIAKVERDHHIRSISKMLGTDIGSGYPSDPVTAGFLAGWVRKNGSLPPHCRRSWDTARRLVSGSVERTLDSFG